MGVGVTTARWICWENLQNKEKMKHGQESSDGKGDRGKSGLTLVNQKGFDRLSEKQSGVLKGPAYQPSGYEDWCPFKLHRELNPFALIKTAHTRLFFI